MTLDQVPPGEHVFVDSKHPRLSFPTSPRIRSHVQSAARTHLASHDAHFDTVPGITRYAPQ